MIVVNLDVMMARRKMSLGELAQKVDITMANLSILKNNHAKAVRFTTLEAICKALELTQNNRSMAARLLKISRMSLYNKMRKYEIS